MDNKQLLLTLIICVTLFYIFDYFYHKSAQKAGMCSAAYGYVQCNGELEQKDGIKRECSMRYVGSGAPLSHGKHHHRCHCKLPRGCNQCNMKDTISSDEPLYTYPALPPIAPEVLTISGFPPSGLSYDRVDPIRIMSIVPPLRELLSDGLENDKYTVTLYKTKWCHYCKEMKPVYDKVTQACKNTNIIFNTIDCDEANVPRITAYPTIEKVGVDGKVRTYIGPANYDKLFAFVMSR